MLEREHAVCRVAGHDVGIAGAKGFVGGFPGSHLPDFGEPLLREVYREAGARPTRSTRASRRSRRARCASRCCTTRRSPPRSRASPSRSGPTWAPIGWPGRSPQHEPDLVLHGHAHAGTFEGRIGDVPVYNVSVPVMRQPFWVFELTLPEHPAAAVH